MSRKVSRTISSKMSASSGGWDAAIRDTEEEIRKTKERLAGLRAVLKIFQDRRDDGDPFPGQRQGQGKVKP